MKSKRISRRGVKQPLNKYPRGWNRRKIQELADYYDNQSDDEAIAEAEAAYNDPRQTVMLVPCELVPQIDKLLAAHNARKGRSAAPHQKTAGRAARRSTHRRVHSA